MRSDRRNPAPAPLELRSIQRYEASTRVKTPLTSKTRVPSPSRPSSTHTSPLSVQESSTRLLSPEKEVSTPSSTGFANSTLVPTSRPTSDQHSSTGYPLTHTFYSISSPTVMVTLTLKWPTVPATAMRRSPASSQALLSSTQSAALIPSTSATTGASSKVIPIKAVGFVAGSTGAAGALLALGLFIFFGKKRRAAAAEAGLDAEQ